ncbi:MAG: hypothetical protein ACP5NX_01630 [Candidatus Bilamarchaeaceae archaeon]
MKESDKKLLFGALVVIALLVLVYVLVLNAPKPTAQPSPQASGAPQAPSGQTHVPPVQPPSGTKAAKGDASDDDGDKQSIETSGEYAASIQYDVKRDGFSFKNYGGEEWNKNLGPAELQRMFGDAVCSNVKEGKCTLTPPAEQWMNEINKGMKDGHCEGMATLSLLFAKGIAKADDFGASTAYELQVEDNEKLMREIAYWFATQSVEPTSASATKMAANDVLEKLSESFKSGAESYTLGIYKRDMTEGHAITPWAIEDKGDGTQWILVYDNNYPGVNRAIVVDKEKNSWKYSGSTNPAVAASEYDGDQSVKNLDLTPTSVRQQKQTCAFCGDSESASGQKAAVKGSLASYNEIWVIGDGEVLIRDANGKRLGFRSGALYQEIPGASFISMKGSGDLLYKIPMGTGFTFLIDGSKLKKASSTDIVMFGPGYDIGLENITLAPGREDTASFSSDGKNLTYTTKGAQSPDIIYGIETPGADYGFAIKAADLSSGGTINTAIDTKKGRLSLNTKGNSQSMKFFFEMSRIDDNGEQVFGNDEGIVLDPGDTMYFNYANWTGDKGALRIELDEGSTGTITESVDLKDEK